MICSFVCVAKLDYALNEIHGGTRMDRWCLFQLFERTSASVQFKCLMFDRPVIDNIIFHWCCAFRVLVFVSYVFYVSSMHGLNNYFMSGSSVLHRLDLSFLHSFFFTMLGKGALFTIYVVITSIAAQDLFLPQSSLPGRDNARVGMTSMDPFLTEPDVSSPSVARVGMMYEGGRYS